MAAMPPVRAIDEIVDEVTYRPESVEIVFVDKVRVSCDGPGAGLGHPRVFFSIDDKGYAECNYCDRVFAYDPARAGERVEGQPSPLSIAARSA